MRARIGTLASTALKNPDREVKASSWRAEAREMSDGTLALEVYHYSTRMLAANVNGTADLTYASTGWGSVSDQNGMNQIMRDLGLRFSMRRDERGGGPRFEEF